MKKASRKQKSRSNGRAPKSISKNIQNNSLPDLGINYGRGRQNIENSRASQDGAPSARSRLAMPGASTQSRSTTNAGHQRYSYNSVPHQQGRFNNSSKASLNNADLKLPQLRNHSNSIRLKNAGPRVVANQVQS